MCGPSLSGDAMTIETPHSQTFAKASGVVGVFDSGLGGLTSLRRLRALAPGCDIVYFGDTARVPYGTRDTETLRRFAREDVSFLKQQGAQQVLVACGTISSVLPVQDWKELPLPCLGVVEAAVQAALAASRNGKIGVLATPATIQSQSYVKRLQATLPDAVTPAVACPAFVPLIEAGQTDSEALRAAAREYLKPICAADCDTLILGCTHYPLIASMLADELQGRVTLIDSGGEAAAALVRSLPALPQGTGTLRCFVSGSAEEFSRHAGAFLGGGTLPEVQHINW